jgi:dienelactone hydrolase
MMRRLSRWVVYFWVAFASAILYSNVVHSLPSAPSQSTNLPVHISTSHTDAIAPLHVTIAGDPADVYLPTNSDANTRANALPIALMLPGALVNRTYYSQFANAIAQHGFAVVVPTHERSIPESGLSGELAEASQIPAALAFLERENANSNSPLYQKLDLSRMALLGHSYGGAVGLQAIANSCTYPFCTPPFSRPDAVKVGVFYGVNTQNPTTGEFSPTANNHIPVALVQGSLDGVAIPDEAIATYNLIQTPPKALITIEGSNHYGITNLNNPPGAMPDSRVPTLEQSRGVETIAQWTAYFLRAHLYQDSDALRQIYRNGRRANRRHRPASSVTIISVLE